MVTLTPLLLSSARKASKKPVIANLLALYAVRPGTPTRPASEETATMWPRLAFKYGSAARETLKVPFRSMSTTVR